MKIIDLLIQVSKKELVAKVDIPFTFRYKGITYHFSPMVDWEDNYWTIRFIGNDPTETLSIYDLDMLNDEIEVIYDYREEAK